MTSWANAPESDKTMGVKQACSISKLAGPTTLRMTFNVEDNEEEQLEGERVLKTWAAMKHLSDHY